MKNDKHRVIIASLLHDLGKVILRAGLAEEREDHSTAGYSKVGKLLPEMAGRDTILGCIRYHHIRYLENAGLPNNHPAWLVCEADNIAAGVDRRQLPDEGDQELPMTVFRSTKCLDSIFNLVHTQRSYDDTKHELPLIYGQQDEQQYTSPVLANQNLQANPSDYVDIWHSLEHSLSAIDYQNPAYLNSIISILEGFLTYVPSSTDKIGRASWRERV